MSELLESLLGEAEKRVLSGPELADLVRAAEAEGLRDGVIIRLLRSGKDCARRNLLASGLRGGGSPGDVHALKDRIKTEGSLGVLRNSPGLAFAVRDHAFERFLERHHPDEELQAALAVLEADARAAHPVREKTLCGDEQWKSPSGVTFVIKRDGPGLQPVCVTVLPKPEEMASRTHGSRRRRSRYR